MNKQIQNLRHLACEILKEIDAIEVKEKVAWVPKVGAYVKSSGNADAIYTIVNHGDCGIDVKHVTNGSMYRNQSIELFRPVTPEEIAEHEAKIEAAKPIQFGTRVEFERDGKIIQGRVAYDTADVDGYYVITFINEDMLNNYAHRSRDEFKVID